MINPKPITLHDRELINPYFQRYNNDLSELTFTNLYVWRHVRPLWFSLFQDSLLLLIQTEEKTANKFLLFGPPIGTVRTHSVLKKFQGVISGAVRLPGSEAALLSEHGISVYNDRDNHDYVYRVIDLAEISGRKFSKKRNLIKQCLANSLCSYEPITGRNIDECLDMLQRWCEIRNCGTTPGLCGEYNAILDTFEHMEQFNLLGGCIRVNGKVEAFSLAERLNSTTAVWHFEKAMAGITGLAQLMNRWFAQNHLQQFQFVNREQDLGIPGLRQAKKSYYPCRMVEKINTMETPPESAITGCT